MQGDPTTKEWMTCQTKNHWVESDPIKRVSMLPPLSPLASLPFPPSSTSSSPFPHPFSTHPATICFRSSSSLSQWKQKTAKSDPIQKLNTNLPTKYTFVEQQRRLCFPVYSLSLFLNESCHFHRKENQEDYFEIFKN